MSHPEPLSASRPAAGLAPEPGAGPAFEALLAGIVSAAYGYAVRLTRNRADAEDLMQEAALLAHRGFAAFEPGTNFKAWFFTILTNCYRSKYRRDRRRPTVELEDVADLYLYRRAPEAGFPREGPDPASALLDKLGTEQVEAALAELPEDYRVVATLYFMQDFSYEEIASAVGCPVGTVRSRLHRGRKMLQKALWHVAAEAGIVRSEGTMNV